MGTMNVGQLLSVGNTCCAENQPMCEARETLLQVQGETMQGLAEARKLTSQIRDLITGPYPEEAKKGAGCGPGAMASRAQVSALCSDLETIH